MNLENRMVSVYIPTKNRLELLNRAVDSILQQTYSNLEIIIVDDGSDDPVILEYLRNLSRENSIVKYFVNEKSKGACYSRNLAINNASGYFITGIDDDDFVEKTHIEQLVSKYEDKYSFIASSRTIITPDNERVLDVMNKTVTQKDISEENCVGNQALLLTSRLKSIGGFDEQLGVWQDYDVWLRIINRYGPGIRISSPTYNVDQSHPWERITLSNSKAPHLEYFIKKNSIYLSKKNVKKTEFEIEIMKYSSISFMSSFGYLFYVNFFKIAKYLCKKKKLK